MSRLFAAVNGNRRITITKISEREIRARFTDIITEKSIKNE